MDFIYYSITQKATNLLFVLVYPKNTLNLKTAVFVLMSYTYLCATIIYNTYLHMFCKEWINGSFYPVCIYLGYFFIFLPFILYAFLLCLFLPSLSLFSRTLKYRIPLIPFIFSGDIFAQFKWKFAVKGFTLHHFDCFTIYHLPFTISMSLNEG